MTVAGVPSVTGVGALLPLGKPCHFPYRSPTRYPWICAEIFTASGSGWHTDPITPSPPCRRPSVGGTGGVQVGLLPIHPAYHLLYTGGVSGREVPWGLGYPHPSLGVEVSFLRTFRDKLGTPQAN